MSTAEATEPKHIHLTLYLIGKSDFFVKWRFSAIFSCSTIFRHFIYWRLHRVQKYSSSQLAAIFKFRPNNGWAACQHGSWPAVHSPRITRTMSPLEHQLLDFLSCAESCFPLIRSYPHRLASRENVFCVCRKGLSNHVLFCFFYLLPCISIQIPGSITDISVVGRGVPGHVAMETRACFYTLLWDTHDRVSQPWILKESRLMMNKVVYLACLNCCVTSGLFQRLTTGQVCVCCATAALTVYSEATWTSCLEVKRSVASVEYPIYFSADTFLFSTHLPD